MGFEPVTCMNTGAMLCHLSYYKATLWEQELAHKCVLLLVQRCSVYRMVMMHETFFDLRVTGQGFFGHCEMARLHYAAWTLVCIAIVPIQRVFCTLPQVNYSKSKHLMKQGVIWQIFGLTPIQLWPECRKAFFQECLLATQAYLEQFLWTGAPLMVRQLKLMVN